MHTYFLIFTSTSYTNIHLAKKTACTSIDKYATALHTFPSQMLPSFSIIQGAKYDVKLTVEHYVELLR